MKQHHPVVERYITHLEAAIGTLDPAERREVLQDIRNHIAEAMAAGKPLDVVLESLGPADALGRAYAVELLLHPQPTRRGSDVARLFRLAFLVAAFSIPTLVTVSTLGSIGISFVVSGVFAFVVGILEAAGLFPWPEVSDVPPILAVFVGPAMVMAGLGALIALGYYVRFVVRAIRRSLDPLGVRTHRVSARTSA